MQPSVLGAKTLEDLHPSVNRKSAFSFRVFGSVNFGSSQLPTEGDPHQVLSPTFAEIEGEQTNRWAPRSPQGFHAEGALSVLSEKGTTLLSFRSTWRG
jgi:hypothetical protein